MTGRVVPLLVAFGLAGCTVGPDYVRPEAALPDRFVNAPDDAPVEASAPVAFWRQSPDPAMADWVEKALANNRDLRAALARVDQARAQAGLAQRQRLPRVDGEASRSRGRLADVDAPGLPESARRYERDDLITSFSWELDLFGRLRRQSEAARARADAQAADADLVSVVVASETMDAYVRWQAAQALSARLRESVALQSRSHALIVRRYDAGGASRLEKVRAERQLRDTESRLPLARAQEATAWLRLQVLAGDLPGASPSQDTGADTVATIPALPQPLALATPARLIAGRPDVRAAERRLAAATADIGVQVADYFPDISLLGTYGRSAEAGASLGGDAARSWSGAGLVRWSWLGGFGRTTAAVRAARFGKEAALAEYEGAVLAAIEDVEAGLVQHAQQSEYLARQAEVLAAAREAARLSRLRYDQGESSSLDLILAEADRVTAESAYVEAQSTQALATIAVYRSFAGGWTGAR